MSLSLSHPYSLVFSHSVHFFTHPLTPTSATLCTLPPQRIANVPFQQLFALITSLTLLYSQIKPGPLGGGNCVEAPHQTSITYLHRNLQTPLLLCGHPIPDTLCGANTIPQPPQAALAGLRFPSSLNIGSAHTVLTEIKPISCYWLAISTNRTPSYLHCRLERPCKEELCVQYPIDPVFRTLSGLKTTNMT